VSQERSRAEFDRFVVESTGGLLRTAYLIVGDLAEAEDLTQETLLKVAQRWPRVLRMERPYAYARRILVNLALDGERARLRRRQELTHEAPLDRSVGHDVAAEFGAREELLRALGQLPLRQRSVLVLRYFFDLPEAEVAATLGCSLGTVKSSASRGLVRLAQELQRNSDSRSVSR
jgi:RNA polymerase sigma-70 factor (sigma-E family)